MNLIADENVDAAMVRWLREQGHDVVWASEVFASEPDVGLLALANSSSRILLTRDLDFGELVYRERRISCGIILLRVKAANQWERLSLLQELWSQIAPHAHGNFIVLKNDKLRIRSLHPPE